MTLISELNEIQKQHLAFRLDNNTACGYLTACKIARMELGDMSLFEVFTRYGDRSPR